MEDFTPYELAVKLKEKGFDYECIAHYDINKELKVCIREPIFWHSEVESYLDAPTISQVLKWLREKKGWVIVVRLYSTNGWYWFIQDEKGELKSSYLASCDDCFSTYELAAIAGIEYVLDNLI